MVIWREMFASRSIYYLSFISIVHAQMSAYRTNCPNMLDSGRGDKGLGLYRGELICRSTFLLRSLGSTSIPVFSPIPMLLARSEDDMFMRLLLSASMAVEFSIRA